MIHLATAALVNAVWDLAAKDGRQAAVAAGRRPVARASSSTLVDFRYLTDVLDRDEALDLLRALAPTRAARVAELRARRVSRVPHVGRAGSATPRTKVRDLTPRRARRRLALLQDQGRRRRRVRRPPLRGDARGDRRPPAHGRRQPGVGRRRRRSSGCGTSSRSTCAGSRSRRAPTTCSATPRSGARSRRSASRPASTPTNRVDLQAAAAGRGDRLLPDRRVPARRRERGARGAAARGEVRRAGVPARRRARAVRVRAAPLDHRLRVRLRFARRPHDRVRRPPPRALRPSRRSCATAATWCRTRRVTRSTCSPSRTPRSRARAGRSGDDAPDRAARSTWAWRSRGSGSAARRSATCSRARRRRRGDATVAAAWDAGHPLLRHRAALRPRAVRAPAGRGAARPPARCVRALVEGRAAAPSRTPTVDPGIFRVARDLAPQFDYSRDGVLRSIEESLERLGLDRLDVVLVHDPDDHEARGARRRVPGAARAARAGRRARDRQRDEPAARCSARFVDAGRSRLRAARRPLLAARPQRRRPPRRRARRAGSA